MLLLRSAGAPGQAAASGLNVCFDPEGDPVFYVDDWFAPVLPDLQLHDAIRSPGSRALSSIEQADGVPSSQWAARTAVLEQEVALLKERCDRLEVAPAELVSISSLSPEPYTVQRSIVASLRPTDDEFVATFYDAELSTSGETRSEAISNLRDLIVETYELLTSLAEDSLGPGPLRQRDVLQEYMRELT